MCVFTNYFIALNFQSLEENIHFVRIFIRRIQFFLTKFFHFLDIFSFELQIGFSILWFPLYNFFQAFICLLQFVKVPLWKSILLIRFLWLFVTIRNFDVLFLEVNFTNFKFPKTFIDSKTVPSWFVLWRFSLNFQFLQLNHYTSKNEWFFHFRKHF